MVLPVYLIAGATAALLSGWVGAAFLGSGGSTASRALRWALRGGPVLLGAGLVLAGTPLPLATALACAAPLGISAALLDWRDGSIADVQSVGLLATGILAAPSLHPYATWMLSLGGGILAAMILGLGNLLVLARTRRNGMGTGDYGLAAAGGVWCGLGWVGPALLIAVAATLGLAVLSRTGIQGKLAFGPGLVIGFAAATAAGRVW